MQPTSPSQVKLTNAVKFNLRCKSSVHAALVAVAAILSTLHPQSARTQTLDALNPGANSSVWALAVQADGKMLAGGVFTMLAGQTFSRLGRLNANGTPDGGFNPGANDNVFALAVQADGKILVGGSFTVLGGQTRNRIARLTSNGTLDTAFNPLANDTVYALEVQPDGKTLVTGAFTTVAGQTRNRIARLNSNGTPDAGFNPGANSVVYALAVQPDGKILIGGPFTSVAGQTRNYIARLNPNGTLDTSFNPGANNNVYTLALQADGRILVGGLFTGLGGQTRNYIGRLNSNGTLDTSFNPGANNTVHSLAVQADGKILVGGNFLALAGQTRNCIGRLNANGTLDASFNPTANNIVDALVVQADGKILVGGSFTSVNGTTRNHIGRLNNTAPATQSLSFDGSTITWLRGGTGPEVWRTTFEFSSDGVGWTSLGQGARIEGGWQLDGVSIPSSDGTIRARGYVAMAGSGCTSSWFVESTIQVGTAPAITLQPSGQTVTNGAAATFRAEATGTPSLDYQWFFNERVIAGATTNYYVISSVQLQDQGSYYVVVSNAFGSVISTGAELTVALPRAATATPIVVNGFIVGFSITEGGWGYTNTPLVRVIGGCGSGAEAVAVVSNGVVVAVQPVNTGSGYTCGPVVVIAPPFIEPPEIRIAALSLLNFTNNAASGNYQLQCFRGGSWIDLGSSFLSSGSTFTQYVSGTARSDEYRLAATPIPRQASAKSVVANGFVVGFTNLDGGSGYTTNPAVTIFGKLGAGSNATATAFVAGGSVTKLEPANPGRGYVNGAEVLIAPPPATCLWPDKVTQIMQLNLGPLSPYDKYQLQFGPNVEGIYGDFGAPFTPVSASSIQYINVDLPAGFFRLRYELDQHSSP